MRGDTPPTTRAPRTRRVARALLLSALLLPAPGLAEEKPLAADGAAERGILEQIDIAGSVRGAYWSTSRKLDDKDTLGVAALWLRGRWQPTPEVALVGDGWVMNDELFDADATKGLFREGYLDLRLGALDLRLGQQIVAWGRADRINPTDNLTSRDFTLLVPEDNDQRTGAVGAVATYHVGRFSLIGVWLPTYQPHIIPIMKPPDPVIVRPRRIPEDPVSQFALKLDQTGGPVDWSVSFFDGIDLYPDLQIVGFAPTKILVAQTYHRIQVLGADFAATAGRFGLRGEMAYTFTEQDATNTIKSPFFLMVLGADRTFLDRLYFNVQYVLRVINDYRNPNDVANPINRAVAVEQATINNQLDEIQHSLTFRLSKKWLNETLETEVGSVLGLARLDYAVRVKAKYAITDHWRATVGADIFRGPSPSFFGRIRDMSTVYVEVRWDY